MKKLNIKVIAACLSLVFFAMTSFGQATSKTTKEAVKKPVTIEKNKVPKEVTETFYKEYPVRTYENWYGYPSFNYQTYWYDYDPYLYSNEYPEYYIVGFNKDNIPYNAVYSKKGEKIAIHKSLTSDIPKAVSSAISKSEYKAWKIGKEKEEIFKDKESDQLKVYKVAVEKGKEKHYLFFQSDGKLLKDKKVS